MYGEKGEEKEDLRKREIGKGKEERKRGKGKEEKRKEKGT